MNPPTPSPRRPTATSVKTPAPGPASSPAPAPKPAPAPRPRFRLAWWPALTLGGVFAVLLARALRTAPPDTFNPRLITAAAGQWVGVLLLTGIVGVVVFYASRRSALATNIAAFVVALSMLTLHGVRLLNTPTPEERQGALEAAESMETLADDFRERDAAGEFATTAEKVEFAAEAMQQAAEKGPDELQKLSAFVTAYAGDMAAATEAFETGFNELVSRGRFDPTGYTSKEAYAETIAELDRLEKANADAKARLAELIDGFDESIRRAGVTAQHRQMLHERYGRVHPLLLEYRDNRARLIRVARARLEVFRDAWGGWTFENDKLRFSPDQDAARARFAELNTELQAVVDDEERLNKLSEKARR